MNYIHWNPPTDIINLGFFAIRWYGMLWGIGLIGATYIVARLFKEYKIADSKFASLFVYVFFGVLLGARLGHCLFYEPTYFFGSLKHFVEMFLPIRFLSEGGWRYTGYAGLASHGGVIGLLIALYLYCRQMKMEYLFVLDSIGFAAPFTAMAIRLGNLMNSEIIGKATDVPWAFVFTRVDPLPRHPAQLYEAIFYAIVFCLGVLLYKKSKEKTVIGSGFFFGYCLTLVFTFRFFVEFIKEVQVDFEHQLALDMGQILSLPLVAIGLYFMWKSKNKLANKHK